MPQPYRYDTYRDARAGSIADLLARRGEIAARGAEQGGQIWGGAVQNIGQTVAAIPQQIQQQKRQARQDASDDLALQGQRDAAGERKRLSDERGAFDSALRDSMVTNPDTGLTTYDRQKAQQLVVGGNMGHLWPQISEILDASDAADTALTKAHEAAIMNSVKLIDAAGNDPGFALHEIRRGIQNRRYSEAEAAPYLDLIENGGAEGLAKITAQILGKKPELMPVNPGDVVIDKNNPQGGAVFTAPPKPEAPVKKDFEWVSRGGKAMQIEKGTAQPGDRPYQPPSQAQGPQPPYQWVNRGGKPEYTNRPQPGDEPLRAPQNTGDTAQDRQRNARTTAARDFLGRLNELRTKINTKMGPAAGIAGYSRRAAANVGLDPDVAEYERIRAAGGRSLAVAIMGAQNLSDADANAWANMLPDARTDEETAKRLTAQVEKMLEGMTASAPARPSPAVDPLGIR